MTALEVLIKAGFAVICGAMIGWEREMHGRPAGLRTHMLMALGVLLFCDVSRAFSPTDSTRIASNIVTGVGFLGAGSILRTGMEVKGLTTAASIWAVTGIVMAISIGGAFYWVALFGTVLTLVTLAFVTQIERAWFPRPHGDLLLVQVEDRNMKSDVIRRLEAGGLEVKSVASEEYEGGEMLKISCEGPRERAIGLALEAPSVRSAKWSE